MFVVEYSEGSASGLELAVTLLMEKFQRCGVGLRSAWRIEVRPRGAPCTGSSSAPLPHLHSLLVSSAEAPVPGHRETCLQLRHTPPPLRHELPQQPRAKPARGSARTWTIPIIPRNEPVAVERTTSACECGRRQSGHFPRSTPRLGGGVMNVVYSR